MLFRYILSCFCIIFLMGCAASSTPSNNGMDTTKFPGTYSMYGRSVQVDDAGQYYVDVYVGGGANRPGAENYSKDEIEKFGKEHGFAHYTIVNSEYTFFPLSKFRVFIKYF